MQQSVVLCGSLFTLSNKGRCPCRRPLGGNRGFFFVVDSIGPRDLFHWILFKISCKLPVPIRQTAPYASKNPIFRVHHTPLQRHPTFCILSKPIFLQNHSQKMGLGLKFPILTSIPKKIGSRLRKSRIFRFSVCSRVQSVNMSADVSLFSMHTVLPCPISELVSRFFTFSKAYGVPVSNQRTCQPIFPY